MLEPIPGAAKTQEKSASKRLAANLGLRSAATEWFKTVKVSSLFPLRVEYTVDPKSETPCASRSQRCIICQINAGCSD